MYFIIPNVLMFQFWHIKYVFQSHLLTFTSNNYPLVPYRLSLRRVDQWECTFVHRGSQEEVKIMIKRSSLFKSWIIDYELCEYGLCVSVRMGTAPLWALDHTVVPKPDCYIEVHSWAAGDAYDDLITNRNQGGFYHGHSRRLRPHT
jgi:hypothetical protein